MSDQGKSSLTSQNFFAPTFIFALAGMMLHPAFFIASLICLTLAMPTRNQRILMAAVSVLFMMVWFGYSVGKDLALRDNQLKASSPQKAP